MGGILEGRNWFLSAICIVKTITVRLFGYISDVELLVTNLFIGTGRFATGWHLYSNELLFYLDLIGV